LSFYGYPNGAVVLSVAQGSPAYNTGIRKGDIITEFNGTTVKDYNDYYKLFEKVSPNQQVSIKIYRGGSVYTASIKIGSNNSVE
jgi:serine protease Do